MSSSLYERMYLVSPHVLEKALDKNEEEGLKLLAGLVFHILYCHPPLLTWRDRFTMRGKTPRVNFPRPPAL